MIKKDKIINTECVYQGKFLTLMRDDVEFFSGRRGVREYLLHPGAAVIVPELPDGRLLLIRQERFALQEVFWEFPAGKRDPPEDFSQTAVRELREETGFIAHEIQFLTRIHPVIGYSNEVMELYYATQLEADKSSLDEGENLEVHPLTILELENLIWSGAVTDVKTQLAYFWYRRKIKKNL